MNNRLPINIQSVFCRLFSNDLSVPEFEEWLLTNEDLEQSNKEIYLELIILDFSKEDIIKQIKQIISNVIDPDECKKNIIIRIMNSLISLDNNFPQSLKQVYDLTSNGQPGILDELEKWVYPLAFEVGVYYDKNWENLSRDEREKQTSPFYSHIKEEAIKIINKIQ